MPTAIERLTSRSYSTDSANQTTATRVFTTDATSQAGAAAAVNVLGVTMPSTHPEYASLSLDTIGYTPKDDGTYDVTANYSATGLFVLDIVKKQNATAKYSRFQFSTYDYEIETPYAVKEKRTVSAPGAGSTVSVEAWMPYIQKVSKTDLVLAIEVRPPKLSVGSATLIANEVNTLHKFSTQPDYWLFVSGAVQPVSNTEDLVTYTWRRDRLDYGWTAVIDPSIPQPNMNLYDNKGGTIKFPDLSRPPFFQWKMKMGTAGPSSDPVFFKICPYSRNDTGYTNLPGLTAAVSL
jgi:hypothetical protein